MWYITSNQLIGLNVLVKISGLYQPNQFYQPGPPADAASLTSRFSFAAIFAPSMSDQVSGGRTKNLLPACFNFFLSNSTVALN
jgi:hypothetical protein